MGTLWAIANKDLRQLWRDKASFFWVLGFPLIMALFFGSIFSGATSGSGSGRMTVLVVDDDRSPFTEALTKELDANSALRVTDTLVIEEARDRVRTGAAVAFVRLPRGLGASYGFDRSDSMAIEIAIDPARRTEAAFLRGMLTQAFFATVQTTFTGPKGSRLIDETRASIADDTTIQTRDREALLGLLGGVEALMGAMTQLGEGTEATDTAAAAGQQQFFEGPPIRSVAVTRELSAPRSSWEFTFPQALLWALIGVTAAFAVGLASERTRGTLMRLRLAPIRRSHILLGKGLAAFVAGLVSTAILILFGILVFGISVADPFKLALALVAAAACFCGLMMLIAVLGRTEQAVGGAGWIILLIMSMTGGAMIPLFVMPSWMQTISHVSAVKWAILAVEGAIWRNFSYAEMAFPVAVLLGIGLVGFAVGSFILTRRDLA